MRSRAFPIFCILLAAAGCRTTAPMPAAPVTVVDRTLTPSRPALPGAGGTERPVGVVVNERGSRAHFVERELIIATNDDAALAAFVTRWRGEVVQTFDPQLPGVPKYHLVRIDPAAADPTTLSANLRRIDNASRGTLRVSSETGLGLFSAAASEGAGGARVGVNWVAEGSGFRDRVITDAPNGEGDYSPNAFEWAYMRHGNAVNTGVADAWRALDMAGRLGGPRIPIGVIDGGFGGEHRDYPPGEIVFMSAIPFVFDARHFQNSMGCGSNPCPWHGMSAALTAMAVPDNGYGAAGPAGPVARPILTVTLGDMFSSMYAITMTAAAGAKIITMSFGAPIPSPLDFTVWPLDTITNAAHEQDILLFGAAGNGQTDVDASHCIVQNCWEHTWHYMCENRGVVCVGATNSGDLLPAWYSNWGSMLDGETVDLWAPTDEFVGMDRAAEDNALLPPGAGSNMASTFGGTSASTPFVAGVAALVWAANPRLSADEVERILRITARPGAMVKVRAVVQAYDAVIFALDGPPNEPPSIAIAAPVHGARIDLGRSVSLIARSGDIEDAACCAVTWTSSDAADRFGATGELINHMFITEGLRTVTATARDSAGQENSATVRFTVVNSSPIVEIDAPPSPLYVHRQFAITGRGHDINEPRGIVDCSRLRWSVSVPSSVVVAANGCRAALTATHVGTYSVILDATDTQGAASRSTRQFSVIDAPDNFPPDVEIDAPRSGTTIRFDGVTRLEASALDPEGNDPVTLVWTVTSYGSGGTVFRGPIEVGRGPVIDLLPSAFNLHDFGRCGSVPGQPARVTVTATDSLGKARSAAVDVEIGCAPQ